MAARRVSHRDSVDAGTITRLTPVLGLQLTTGPIAHEQMRRILEASVNDDPDHGRRLAADRGYQVAVPQDGTPTWWPHLVLIYPTALTHGCA